MNRFPLFTATFLLVAACVGPELDAVRRLEPQAGSFTDALSVEYRSLALFEADEMYDWIDAGFFARKALMAARGLPVAAERPEIWNLSAERVAELADARLRLTDALDRGGRERHPVLAAQAQGAFDCWLEQQEEGHQPDHIARCRDALEAALGEIEQRLALAAETLAPAAGVAGYPSGRAGETGRLLGVLFFATGRASLSEEARGELSRVAEGLTAERLVLIGHSDRAGPAEANLALSLRRAEAAGRYLGALGIDPGRIRIEARGEADPAVVTPDGTALQANRRVEVLSIESRARSARPGALLAGLCRCAGPRGGQAAAEALDCPCRDEPCRSQGRGGLAYAPVGIARRRAAARRGRGPRPAGR